MKVSVLISIDLVKGTCWSQLIPEIISWTIVEAPVPSEALEDARHIAFTKTISLDDFLDLIKKYEIFSIDDIGRNMAIRMSCTKPGAIIHVYASPELEADEQAKDGGPDYRYYSAAWTHILKAISDGARNASAKAPQPLKSEGENADAIHNPQRRSKAAR